MKEYFRYIYSSGSLLILVTVVSNFLNFLFNAFLGRVLSFEEFGIITLINTFWYLTSVFLSSLGATVNHRISYLLANEKKDASVHFLKNIRKHVFIISLIVSFCWIIASPLFSSFFHIENPLTLLFFTPVITLGVVTAVNRGYLYGKLCLSDVALIIIIESLAKFCFAVLFVFLHLNGLVYLSIPLSIASSFLVSTIIISKRTTHVEVDAPYQFPGKFFTGALFTHLSSVAFLTMDVILVKHFLSPESAGEYAVLSIVGKMVFFFGGLPNMFMIPLIARNKGHDKNQSLIFYRLFTATAFLAINAFVVLGPLGYLFVPLLLGEKSTIILPYLTLYTFSFALFSLTNSIVMYHLAREENIYPQLSLLFSLLMAVVIVVFHQNISQITQVILLINAFSFITMFSFHFLGKDARFIIRIFLDLIDILFPLETQTKSSRQAKRILIFNWRDTRHIFAGGAEVYIHELAKRWVREGNVVTVFCGNDGNSPRNEMVDGVQIIRRGGFYFVYFWAFVYYLVQFRGKFDVIIDCENGIPFFTPLYAKEKTFLVIHHVHQDIFRKSLKQPFSLIASFLEMKAMPYLYRNVRIITVSPSSAKEILDHKLTLIPPVVAYNGVDTTVFKPGIKSITPNVLYLGRLKYYKSINIFIHAAKKVLEHIPSAQFIIAGDGEEKAGLAKLVKKLNIENSIAFLGKVTEKEKIRLYQNAWVFVNPSFMEGWGITSIEANACGTPVIASDVPGLRDSVKNPHGGFLVPYADINTFAERILLIITDEKLRIKMSQDSVKWAKKYSWERSAQLSLRLFDQKIKYE